MKDRKMLTVDEDALRDEVGEMMQGFIADYDEVVRTRAVARSHLLDMHRRVWWHDVGLNRFLARTR